jgi:hypothetical protein
MNHPCPGSSLDCQFEDLSVLARLPFLIERQVKRFDQSRGFFEGIGAEQSSVDFDGYHLLLQLASFELGPGGLEPTRSRVPFH